MHVRVCACVDACMHEVSQTIMILASYSLDWLDGWMVGWMTE